MSIDLVSTNQQPQAQQIPIATGSFSGLKSVSNSQSTSNIPKIIANAEKTIANEVTTVNDNGTITVNTTYSDGTTLTVTNANPPRPAISQNPLAANNGQLTTLLKAQQQSNQG